MASRSSNKTAVPEAKGAMNKFKYEVASELGVPLTDGYNGDLTSKQNGSVGGYMVKKMIGTAGEADGRKVTGEEKSSAEAVCIRQKSGSKTVMYSKKNTRNEKEKSTRH